MKIKLGKVLLLVFGGLGILTGLAVIFIPDIRCYQKHHCIVFSEIRIALQSYYLDHGRLPDNIDSLLGYENKYLSRRPIDNWENEIVYVKLGDNVQEYILISYGADGILGGAGMDADKMSNTNECP